MRRQYNWLLLPALLLVAVLLLGGCVKTSRSISQDETSQPAPTDEPYPSPPSAEIREKTETAEVGEAYPAPTSIALREKTETAEAGEAYPAPTSIALREKTETAEADEIAEAVTQDTILAALQESLNGIYTRVNPAVVNIRIVQRHRNVTPRIPDLPFEIPQEDGPPQDFFVPGLGSGFVWDTEGHIVTNNHVVQDAERISVTFSDGTTVDGEIVGADPDSDLAVVKVDMPADQLTPINVTDSFDVEVGDFVVAIGNPFGLESTMTVGFVSAVGRSLPVDTMTVGPTYSIPYIIQTDASINPGNSGGVMVNLNGELIGVPSAIRSPVQASVGIGFAIPSFIVQQVVPVLIEQGSYTHPWLGIMGRSLTPETAVEMGLAADQRGALVLETTEDGPSDQAGIQGSDREVVIEGASVQVGGDVIIAFDGRTVEEFDDLIEYLARYAQVGQEVVLTVLRDGEELDIPVTLGARPEPEENESPEEPVIGEDEEDTEEESAEEEEVESNAWLGIEGRTLTAQIAREMGLSSSQRGVLVSQVLRGSPADQAKLRGSFKRVTIDGEAVMVGGDVIIAIDGQTVRDMEDLVEIIREARPGEEIELTLLRRGDETTVTVTLAERP